MVGHPRQFTFASGGSDKIKKWQLPQGRFMQNLEGHNAIINCMALNSENVLVSGGDDGTMSFWDYKTGCVVCLVCWPSLLLWLWRWWLWWQLLFDSGFPLCVCVVARLTMRGASDVWILWGAGTASLTPRRRYSPARWTARLVSTR